MSYSPIVSGSGLIGWEFLNRTREKQQTAFEQSPLIARDKARFEQQIQSVQTSEQLMDNRDLLRVALGAFGLEEDINNRAFIQKVLDSDLSDGTSLANRLADKRYLALAKTFNFAGADGPRFDAPEATDLSAKLGALKTPDDLLSDPSLLRATLKGFGLESSVGNTFFLQKVLESDLNDSQSFVNRLSDKRYLDLAKTFDFQGRAQNADTLYGFADAFSGRIGDLETADDLLDDADLLNTALRAFGVDKDFANIDKPGFLKSVMESDPYDDASFAAQLDDKRYVALSKAFGFGDPDTVESKAEKLITALSARSAPIEQVSDLFNDVSLTITVMDFFNLPQGVGKVDVARKIADSDPDNPVSMINLTSDKRYLPFADAFNYTAPSEGRVYPQGFIDTITQSYMDRQFESAIGESDTNMRIALSLERDLGNLVALGGGTDTQWFSVMASTPLRKVFETALGLPSSFGSLDLDQQLNVFKDRAEQRFGTSKVSDFADPEKLDSLRNRFLLLSGQQGTTTYSSGASVVLALLSGNAI